MSKVLSPHVRNNSPKVLQHKVNNSKSKSVSTYLKELSSKDLISSCKFSKDYHNEANPNKMASVEIDANSVINALKLSSKGSLQYPEEYESFENSEDVCDFKFIGDISHLEFSNCDQNSFHELPETIDENEDIPEDKQYIENLNSLSRSFRIDEERDCENELSISSCLNEELLISQLQIKSERSKQAQTQCLKRKESYLKELKKIHQAAGANLNYFRKLDREERENNKKNLQLLKEVLNEEVEKIVENYSESMQQRQADVLKKLEEIKFENVKNKAYKDSLVQIFHDHHLKLKEKLGKVQKHSENCADSKILDILFKNMPFVISTMQMSMESDQIRNASEDQIKFKLIKVKECHLLIDKINELIDARDIQQAKDAKAANDAKVLGNGSSDSHPQFDAAQMTPVTSSQVDTASSSDRTQGPFIFPVQTQSSADHPRPDNGAVIAKSSDPSDITYGGKRYRELKSKYSAASLEADKLRENVNLRPQLAKAVGIINQLNNSKHDSSNRSKLQQTINLISGRTCSFGDNSVSTQNNPIAQAFVKEQLAARLVSLSHDIQVSTMSVYASFIIRLWQLYPDLGELTLFKLFETCPFLVPLTIRKKENQTEEEFNRSLGFRHKDGGYREAIDKYLTRMGAAAQLYARIVCMDIDNHPHGIEEGWIFLARTLSGAPYPSITAAILHGFISIAGHLLNKTYKKQFHKLIQYLYVNYLPLIEKDTLEGGQSDVVSLKLLLEQFAKTRNFAPPEEGYKLLL